MNPLNKILGRRITVDLFSKQYDDNLSFPEDFKKIRRRPKGTTYLDSNKKYSVTTEPNEGKAFIWVPKGRENTKPVAKMSDVQNVVSSPFLTPEEKQKQLTEMGATRSIIQLAKMKHYQNKRRNIGGGQW